MLGFKPILRSSVILFPKPVQPKRTFGIRSILHDKEVKEETRMTIGRNITNAITEINDSNNFKFLRVPMVISKHDPFNIEQYERKLANHRKALELERDKKIGAKSKKSSAPSAKKIKEDHAVLVSFLDTNQLVEDLKKGGFTGNQSEIIMNVVRQSLQKKMNWIQSELAPKVDMENSNYLFKAAGNELEVEVTNAREIALMNLQNSSIILKRQLNNIYDETSTRIQLNDDTIKMELSQFKHINNLRQKRLEIKNNDLNNRIISELMSGLRSTIEQFRWELTRAGIFAIMLMAGFILGGWRLTKRKDARKEAQEKAQMENVPKLPHMQDPADQENRYYEADWDENLSSSSSPVQSVKK